MDLQTIEKIIDELAKGKESLKFNDDSISHFMLQKLITKILCIIL